MMNEEDEDREDRDHTGSVSRGLICEHGKAGTCLLRDLKHSGCPLWTVQEFRAVPKVSMPACRGVGSNSSQVPGGPFPGQL